MLHIENVSGFTTFLVSNQCYSASLNTMQDHGSSWEVHFRQTSQLIFSCTCYVWRHASSFSFSRSLLGCCFWVSRLPGYWPTAFHLSPSAAMKERRSEKPSNFRGLAIGGRQLSKLEQMRDGVYFHLLGLWLDRAQRRCSVEFLTDVR